MEGLNERHNRTIEYLKEKKKTTNKEYISINFVSRQTAPRELADLTKKGIQQQEGGNGRNTFYILR